MKNSIIFFCSLERMVYFLSVNSALAYLLLLSVVHCVLLHSHISSVFHLILLFSLLIFDSWLPVSPREEGGEFRKKWFILTETQNACIDLPCSIILYWNL